MSQLTLKLPSADVLLQAFAKIAKSSKSKGETNVAGGVIASNSTVTVLSTLIVTALVFAVDESSSVPLHAFTLYPGSGLAVRLTVLNSKVPLAGPILPLPPPTDVVN